MLICHWNDTYLTIWCYGPSGPWPLQPSSSMLPIGLQPCTSQIPPHCIGPSVYRPSASPGTKRMCPNTLSASRSSPILRMCSYHRRRWSLNNVDSDASWYNVHSSSFLIILHCPPSFTGPNILLNTFRSNISNMSADFWLRTQVSLPSETTGLMRDLYILSLEDYERLRLLKRLLMAK